VITTQRKEATESLTTDHDDGIESNIT